jgi:hypothetical protein
LFHGERYINLTVQSADWPGQYDALTSYGVNLWDPELHQWCEVSVQGQCYTVRDTATRIGIPLDSDFSNELKDGSIIDLHGVLLYFQKPYRLRQRLMVSLLPPVLYQAHRSCSLVDEPEEIPARTQRIEATMSSDDADDQFLLS